MGAPFMTRFCGMHGSDCRPAFICPSGLSHSHPLFVIPQRSGGICIWGCKDVDSFVALRNDKQMEHVYSCPMYPRREFDFWVYIMASRSLQLYIGMTNSLRRRVDEHKAHLPGSYTARYNIDRLVYYEHFQYVHNAIAREKELKDWNRAKKLALIEEHNPTWIDLSEAWRNADSSRALCQRPASQRHWPRQRVMGRGTCRRIRR